MVDKKKTVTKKSTTKKTETLVQEPVAEQKKPVAVVEQEAVTPVKKKPVLVPRASCRRRG